MKKVLKIFQRIKNNYILISVVIFFMAANLIWLASDQAPPMWDQAHYLENSQILYYNLTKEGIFSFAETFSKIFQTKAPLITALPLPFYLIFGNHYTSALFVNLLFIIISSCFLYKLGMLISDKKTALLSVIILNLFPLIFAMSREFLVEYGLMTLVIAWMYYLLKSSSFEDRKFSIYLGIVLGLGMLMKISFLLYVISPTVFVLIKKIINEKKVTKAILLNIFIAAFIGILIAGTWYFRNLSSIVQFALSSGFGSVAKNWGMGDIFSVKTMLSYWTYLINYGISAYFFILIIYITAAKLVSFIRSQDRLNKNPYSLFLLLWFLIPFIIFTFGVNKDYRYVAPFLPVMGLFISSGLIKVLSLRYGALLLIFLMLFPIFNYIFISFSIKPHNFEIKPFILLSNGLSYAHPPRHEIWPLEKIIKFVRKDAMRMENDNPLVTLLFNHNYLNFINLNYYSRRQNLNVRFNTVDFLSKESIEEIDERIQKQTDYILIKSDDLGPKFTNMENIQMLSRLRDRALNFKKIETIPLPDKTTLSIYRRNYNDFSFSDIKEIRKYSVATDKEINFSDKIQLLDFKLEKTKERYMFIFFWKCIAETDRNYKIFVHIKDSSDKPVFYADHYPKYPTFLWGKWKIIMDGVDVPLDLPPNFRIYCGIYEESTGSRLLVKGKEETDPVNVAGVRVY